MLLHQWIKLDRDNASKVIQFIETKKDGIVFSKELTDVSFRSLPFYTNYKLYKLSNYASMPVFTMFYLGDGENFIALNGLAAPIYKSNELDGLGLTERTVTQYIKFFFRYVQGSEGEVFLIKEPQKMPYLNTLPKDQQNIILNTCKPLELTSEIENNSEMIFKIHAFILYGDSVIKASTRITTKGEISFDEQEMITSGILLPNNIYNINDDF